jgi:hypothetical protein
MAAKQTDEGMPIAAIRVYVKKHFPNATAEYMQDAARWVVMGSQGKSYLRDVIGTGPTELKAWRGAYKTAQETVSIKTNTVPPEKIYDDPYKPPPGANVWSHSEKRWKPLVNGKEYPVIEHKLPGGGTITMNPITGKTNLIVAVERKSMPVGWHPERIYAAGEIVHYPEGNSEMFERDTKLIKASTPLPTPMFSTVKSDYALGADTYEEKLAKQKFKLAQQKVAEDLEYAEEAKIKKQIMKEAFKQKVAENYEKIDKVVPLNVFGQPMSPGKIIPIDSKPMPKLNPILMVKGQLEEDFPEYEAPKDNTKMNGQADLTNVTLNQQIVLAGLGNVILRQAYSAQGQFSRKIGIYCTKCRGEKTYYKEYAFKLVEGKLHEELIEFCFAHRHDGSAVPIPLMHHPATPEKPAGFRKFREDD